VRSSIFLLSLVTACGTTAPSTGGNDAAPGSKASTEPKPDASGTLATTDFARPGPHAIGATTGSLSRGGCTLAYELYEPADASNAPLVVLGHGFSRDRSNVAGIAEHIASFGVRVATPNFCHSSFSDTDHVQNAEDAAALSAALAGGSAVIHAGPSAGGLSAVLAGARDEATIAVLGLDLTDADELALGAANDLAVPALGLVGNESSCNASGNGRGVFAAMPEGQAIHVVGATHCDFEDPTGSLCTTFCGGSAEDRLHTVKALAAAFVAWRSGIDSTGQEWTLPTGTEFARLQSAGAIAPL